MLLCPSCRARLPQEAERCPRCGADVRVAVVVSDQPTGRRTWGRRRSRISPPMRRALVATAAVIAVVLLGFSLSKVGGGRSSRSIRAPTTARSPSTQPGKMPVVLGNSYLCPLGYPFRAYERVGLFYPPNHPLLPASTVRPSRCFPTAQQARLAGYGEASTPPGAFQVAGVYLLPVALTDQCRVAANVLGFAVPCPSYLPRPGPGVAGPGCGQYGPFILPTKTPCVLPGKIFYFEEAGFAIPPGFAPAGAGSPAADLILTAFPARGRASHTELPFNLECPEAESLGPTSLSLDEKRLEVEAQVLYCPTTVELPLGGHLIVLWISHSVRYQVALSGDEPGHQELLLQIAAFMVMVGSH